MRRHENEPIVVSRDVKAVLLSVGVEFTGALLSALVWLVAVLAG